jgi:hypothetical protein
MKHSDEINEIADALAVFQGGMTPLTRDAEGQIGHRKYRYATLASIDQAITEPLVKVGLSYSQSVYPVAQDGMHLMVCTTRVMHNSGQWLEGTACVPLDPAGSNQDFGVDTSYVRRYGLSAVLGLVAEDDTDGAKGNGQQAKREYPQEDPLPADKDDGPSQAQQRMFYALRKKLDLTDEDVAKALEHHGCSAWTFEDLTKKEASKVLSAMKEKADAKT